MHQYEIGAALMPMAGEPSAESAVLVLLSSEKLAYLFLCPRKS